MGRFDLPAELARRDYKPGWSFAYEVDEHGEGDLLAIAVTFPDYRNGGTSEQRIVTFVPPFDENGVCTFDEWLRWRLGRIELHERDEALRRDGAVIRDPHEAVR
jgi:hypothetical protein